MNRNTVKVTTSQKTWFHPLLQLSQNASQHYKQFYHSAHQSNARLDGHATHQTHGSSHSLSMMQVLEEPLKQWLTEHTRITTVNLSDLIQTDLCNHQENKEIWHELLLESPEELERHYQIEKPNVSLADKYQQQILEDLYNIQWKFRCDWYHCIKELVRHQPTTSQKSGKSVHPNLGSLHGELLSTRIQLEKLINKVQIYLTVFHIKVWFDPLLQLSQTASQHYKQFCQSATLFNAKLDGNTSHTTNILSHGFSMAKSLQESLKEWLTVYTQTTSVDLSDLIKIDSMNHQGDGAIWFELALENDKELEYGHPMEKLNLSLADKYQQQILEDLYDIQSKFGYDWRHCIKELLRHQLTVLQKPEKSVHLSLAYFRHALSETRAQLNKLIKKVQVYLPVFYIYAEQSKLNDRLANLYPMIYDVYQTVSNNTFEIEGAAPRDCMHFFIDKKQRLLDQSLTNHCEILEKLWGDLLSGKSEPIGELMIQAFSPLALGENELALKNENEIKHKISHFHDFVPQSLVSQFEKQFLYFLLFINHEIIILRNYFYEVIYRYNCISQASMLDAEFGQEARYTLKDIKFQEHLSLFKNNIGNHTNQLKINLSSLASKNEFSALEVSPPIVQLFKKLFFIRKNISENYYVTYWVFNEFFKNIQQGQNVLQQSLILSHQLSTVLLQPIEKLSQNITSLVKDFPVLYALKSDRAVQYYLNEKASSPESIETLCGNESAKMGQWMKQYTQTLQPFETPLYQMGIELLHLWRDLIQKNEALLFRGIQLVRCQGTDFTTQRAQQAKVIGISNDEYSLIEKIDHIQEQLKTYHQSKLFYMSHQPIQMRLNQLISIKDEAIKNYKQVYNYHQQLCSAQHLNAVHLMNHHIQAFEKFRQSLLSRLHISFASGYAHDPAITSKRFLDSFGHVLPARTIPALNSAILSEQVKLLYYDLLRVWTLIINNIDEVLKMIGKNIIENNTELYFYEIRKEQYPMNYYMNGWQNNGYQNVFRSIMNHSVEESIKRIQDFGLKIQASYTKENNHKHSKSIANYCDTLKAWASQNPSQIPLAEIQEMVDCSASSSTTPPRGLHVRHGL